MADNTAIGWWLLPLTITALCFSRAVWALHVSRYRDPGMTLFFYPAATIVSLVAWLIGALTR